MSAYERLVFLVDILLMQGHISKDTAKAFHGLLKEIKPQGPTVNNK